MSCRDVFRQTNSRNILWLVVNCLFSFLLAHIHMFSTLVYVPEFFSVGIYKVRFLYSYWLHTDASTFQVFQMGIISTSFGHYMSSQKNVLWYYAFQGFHTYFNEEILQILFLKIQWPFTEVTAVVFCRKEFTLIYFQTIGHPCSMCASNPPIFIGFLRSSLHTCLCKNSCHPQFSDLFLPFVQWHFVVGYVALLPSGKFWKVFAGWLGGSFGKIIHCYTKYSFTDITLPLLSIYDLGSFFNKILECYAFKMVWNSLSFLCVQTANNSVMSPKWAL